MFVCDGADLETIDSDRSSVSVFHDNLVPNDIIYLKQDSFEN